MNPMQVMGMMGGGLGGQSNPMMQLIQMMQGGGNPRQLLGMIAQQNPQVAQLMQSLNGKSPGDMQTMAQNLAKERGVDLNQFAQQMGIKIPK